MVSVKSSTMRVMHNTYAELYIYACLSSVNQPLTTTSNEAGFGANFNANASNAEKGANRYDESSNANRAASSVIWTAGCGRIEQGSSLREEAEDCCAPACLLWLSVVRCRRGRPLTTRAR